MLRCTLHQIFLANDFQLDDRTSFPTSGKTKSWIQPDNMLTVNGTKSSEDLHED